MNKGTVLRVARPTDQLEKIAQMYMEGLGFERLGEFREHDGFDGVMLGLRSHAYHLEFTQCQHEKAGRAPTQDHLLAFYIPDAVEWVRTCEAMVKAGFVCKPSFNPYWDRLGKTFEDVDGYRVVIQKEQWLD